MDTWSGLGLGVASQGKYMIHAWEKRIECSQHSLSKAHRSIQNPPAQNGQNQQMTVPIKRNHFYSKLSFARPTSLLGHRSHSGKVHEIKAPWKQRAISFMFQLALFWWPQENTRKKINFKSSPALDSYMDWTFTIWRKTGFTAGKSHGAFCCFRRSWGGWGLPSSHPGAGPGPAPGPRVVARVGQRADATCHACSADYSLGDCVCDSLNLTDFQTPHWQKAPNDTDHRLQVYM